MLKVNKKLWSFNFGCLIAVSFLWLIGVGDIAPIPTFLQTNTEFVFYYYPSLVIALSALMLTIILLVIMKKVFGVCSYEYTFWLLIPSLTLLVLTSITAFNLLSSILIAVIPAFLVIFIASFLARSRIKNKQGAELPA